MPNWDITDSADEQSLEELFRDADQVYVPVFQRSYIWTKRQFDQLRNDIRLIRDEIEKSQFLGAIVAYERPRMREVVGRLRTLDVVDGQQRLLTLYVFVMVVAERIAALDRAIAMEIVREFLLLPPRRGLDVNTRIVPAYTDREQFRNLWNVLLRPDVLGSAFGEDLPQLPAPAGDGTGPLLKQYARIGRFIQDQLPDDEGAELPFLRELLDILTRRLTFVHLKLNDASVAPKIFERLNFRGVRVEILDLVRNEVFSRATADVDEAYRLYHSVWRPFEASYNGRADAFFFPYCLIHDSNTKKSELFTELRAMWSDLAPGAIISHMTPYRAPYLAIDQNLTEHYSARLRQVIDQLYRLRRPTSAYPFVMKLLYEYERGQVDHDACAELLDAVESFLVRRAIVGFEPTGLHALFKDLWRNLNGTLTVDALRTAVRNKPTIQWPSNDELTAAIASRSLAKAKICRFLLVEYDRSLPGDHPMDEPTIEHILPQTYHSSGPWSAAFSSDDHKRLRDTLPNLIPLSSALNESIQAGPYEQKRPRYAEESMFVTPRRIAAEWTEWTPAAILERAEILGEWAVNRWRHGP